MAIYGTALLSFCLLVGLLAGKLFGWMLGMDGNIGGVGIAMLLLILLTDRLKREGALPEPSEQGILFWSSIYIPVIVAMAASQNVRAAIHGGPVVKPAWGEASVPTTRPSRRRRSPPSKRSAAPRSTS